MSGNRTPTAAHDGWKTLPCRAKVRVQYGIPVQVDNGAGEDLPDGCMATTDQILAEVATLTGFPVKRAGEWTPVEDASSSLLTLAVRPVGRRFECDTEVHEQILEACEAAHYWLMEELANPGQAKPNEILRVLSEAIVAATGQPPE